MTGDQSNASVGVGGSVRAAWFLLSMQFIHSAVSTLTRSPPEVPPPYARVALGDCSPRAPTDPDVPDYGIRLFTTWIRYAMSL
jgi:hypothetical protein